MRAQASNLRQLTAALLCLMVGGSAALASLEGRWRLTHQSYGDGAANLADRERPLHLEITSAGGRLHGRLWRGDDALASFPWPSFITDAGPAPVERVETALEEGAGRIRAVYRVRPAPGDDLVLVVVEEYRLLRNGKQLAGTLRVDFSGGDRNRGGYVLHRRFERVP